MTAEDILKILFLVLCDVKDGKVTVTQKMLDAVPHDWMNMLEIDRPGVSLYRLQVKNKAKPRLWDKDIIVPLS